MTVLRLEKPALTYADELDAFRREVLAAGDADSFAGCYQMENCATMEEWLALLDDQEGPDHPLGVPSSVYVALDEQDRVTGVIDLRHHIGHPILGVWGGHIGYTVRPSQRGRGYGAEMLRLNRQNARARGMTRELITCSASNPASERIIIANGGVFEKEGPVEDDVIRRYWVTL